jgi:hypothetical protein
MPLKKRFIVRLYAGVLLTYPIQKDREESYATLSKADLFLWCGRQLKKENVDTNAFSYLDTIQKYLADLSVTADFNLIEPVK